MKPDITSRADIERLVNLFYEKVKTDSVLKPFFGSSKFINWETHLPIMYGFWEFILFSTDKAYTGGVMSPHIKIHEQLPMKPEHFERWLLLFSASVDELFEGEKASEAIKASQNIGSTLKYKILGASGFKFDVKIVEEE
jgi:hemoglobin